MSSKRKRGTHKKVGECLDPKKRGRQRGKKPSSSADEEISAISATRSESDCTDDDFEDMKDHQKADNLKKCSKSSYSFESLVEACKAVNKGQSIRSAASGRGIPESTLRRYISGQISPGFDRRKMSPYFTDAQECDLAKHIAYMSNLGYHYSRWQVLEMAANMMKAMGRKEKPAKQWFLGFVKRHPTVSKAACDKVTLQQKLAFYFAELNKLLEETSLKSKPTKILYVEETVIDTHRCPPRVISRRGNKGCSLQMDKLPSVSIIGGGNAKGEKLPPYIVLCPGESMLRCRNALRGVISGSKIKTSPKGWPSAEIYEEYCCRFLPKFLQLPVIALYDANNTNVSLIVLEKTKKLGIHLFPLQVFVGISNTHLSSAFHLFKKVFVTECKSSAGLLSVDGSHVTSDCVWSTIVKSYNCSMSPSSLQISFHNTGIFPFNKEAYMAIYHDISSRKLPKQQSSAAKGHNSIKSDHSQADFTCTSYQPPYDSDSDVKDSDEDDNEECMNEDAGRHNDKTGRTLRSAEQLNGADVGLCILGTPDQDLGDTEGETLEIVDEVCVICQRSNPYMLEFVDPNKKVIIEWGQCHVCSRWVHLKFCCPDTQLGPSDTFKCPICAHMAMQEQTRRLRTRQKRKFRMPSREEIWDKIPDTPSGRSTYSHLKPRKLVNNFTKENSRYNFDPDYTSGEDSIQDFVVPDDEVKSADSEVSESDDSRTTASSKNRENREKGETSDSSDASSVQSDGSSNQYGRRLKKTRLQRGPRNQVNNDDNCTDESMNGRDSGDSDSDGKNNNVQSESDGSSNQYGKNLRKRRQRKIRIKALESSSDSDSGSCQSSHPPEVQTDQQEADSISPDSHNVNNNTPDQPVQSVMFKALKNYIQSKQPQLQMTNVMNSPGSQASSKNESIVDERMSDSEGENCRESSDSSGGNQESRRRRSKRQAARDLFADFKMTRAHRKKPK